MQSKIFICVFCFANATLGSPLVVNARNGKGLIPLHIASNYGNTRVAGLLISKRAYVNARDHEGNTPLHLTGTTKMLTLLKMARADASISNKKGETPISCNAGQWLEFFRKNKIY